MEFSFSQRRMTVVRTMGAPVRKVLKFLVAVKLNVRKRITSKGAMDQVRVILVSLFPALWAVTGQNFARAPLGTWQARCSISICARQAGKATSNQSAAALAQNLRNASRRAGIQLGSGDWTPAFDAVSNESARPLKTGFIALESHSVVQFSRPWQFHWRTASEPRAPSSVS
jgi:hypothetical protein